IIAAAVGAGRQGLGVTRRNLDGTQTAKGRLEIPEEVRYPTAVVVFPGGDRIAAVYVQRPDLRDETAAMVAGGAAAGGLVGGLVAYGAAHLRESLSDQGDSRLLVWSIFSGMACSRVDLGRRRVGLLAGSLDGSRVLASATDGTISTFAV